MSDEQTWHNKTPDLYQEILSRLRQGEARPSIIKGLECRIDVLDERFRDAPKNAEYDDSYYEIADILDALTGYCSPRVREEVDRAEAVGQRARG